MAKSPNYSVPALERGLDILEALGAAAVPQSLTDLGGRLERSASSLFRVLNCLERRNYVTRDPISGKYVLSLKLFALAHTHSPVEGLLRAARPSMQALAEELGESCHLSVLERGRLLVVAQHDSPAPVRVSIEVGAEFDPLQTVSGRLLIANLELSEREAILASSPAWKCAGPAMRKARLKELDQIRLLGVSQQSDESIKGLADVAVLVGQPGIAPSAALAITRFHGAGSAVGPAERQEKLELAATEISAKLGLEALDLAS